jgi:hypothetical protein
MNPEKVVDHKEVQGNSGCWQDLRAHLTGCATPRGSFLFFLVFPVVQKEF